MVETGGWGASPTTRGTCARRWPARGSSCSLLTNREWELADLASGFEVDRCFSGTPATSVTCRRSVGARGPARRTSCTCRACSRLAGRPALAAGSSPAPAGDHGPQHALARAHPLGRLDALAVLRAADAVVVTRAGRRGRAAAPSRRPGRAHPSRRPGVPRRRERPDRGARARRLGLPSEARSCSPSARSDPYKGLHGIIAALPELRAGTREARLGDRRAAPGRQ